MNRCTAAYLCLCVRHLRRALAAGLAGVVMWSAMPAAAQVALGLGGMRTFPDAALRGTLTINTVSEVTLNGRAIRMAPGMRLFSPQNTLVMPHTVLGQRYKVNYLIEDSTGMLLSAWILTDEESAQPRKGSNDHVQHNFRTGSDAIHN